MRESVSACTVCIYSHIKPCQMPQSSQQCTNTYQIYRWSIVHTNLIMDTHTCIIQWLIKLFPYEAPGPYQLAV